MARCLILHFHVLSSLKVSFLFLFSPLVCMYSEKYAFCRSYLDTTNYLSSGSASQPVKVCLLICTIISYRKCLRQARFYNIFVAFQQCISTDFIDACRLEGTLRSLFSKHWLKQRSVLYWLPRPGYLGLLSFQLLNIPKDRNFKIALGNIFQCFLVTIVIFFFFLSAFLPLFYTSCLSTS